MFAFKYFNSMTFLRFVYSRVKTTNSNYWMLLSLRIFVRLMGVTTMFYFLSSLNQFQADDINFMYGFISTVFYILFFVFLDWYIKVSLKSEFSRQGQKWLNILKWIPLLFCLVLIYLTSQLNVFSWPGGLSNRVIYSYMKVWPAIFVPNLSFIIITLLIFYTSAILNRNKQLKEENDLTI